MDRRTFLVGTLASTAAATATASGIAYGADTHDVETTTVPLNIGLGRPLRVVVIGDIHFDPLFEEAYIASVVDGVNRLRPDLLLYTGDFISRHADRVNDLSDILAFATARLGAYTVPGNHEHWTGIEIITRSLQERAGIYVLRNETIPLPGAEHTNFWLTGIDSFWSGTPDLSTFQRAPADARHIVLVHEPDSFAKLSHPGIRLQISGHTHGGQVRLPFVGAVVLPKWGHDFQTGLYEQDGRYLYVNRGIGTLVPHIRVNCRPEITVFELT
jgi:predicted MPP superfamily phosphohydrolase